MLRSLLATGLALLIASPALADAVTYKGTLGKSEIVVELSSPIEAPDAAVVGRYAYTRKGIDIPLDLVSAAPGELTLTEQRPCTEDICGPAFEAGTFPEELRGAVWALASSDDGATITGTWQDGDEAPIALTLERVGSRPVDLYEPVTVDQLLMLPSGLYDGTEDLSVDNAPYDFLKTQTRLTEGEETRWGDVAFRYVTDPRTKFPFPRVTDLGGADLSAVNTRLASRHALISTSALECASHVYFGMGWISGMDASAPSLGDYDQENIEVTYLSPTLMSWDPAVPGAAALTPTTTSTTPPSTPRPAATSTSAASSRAPRRANMPGSRARRCSTSCRLPMPPIPRLTIRWMPIAA